MKIRTLTNPCPPLNKPEIGMQYWVLPLILLALAGCTSHVGTLEQTTVAFQPSMAVIADDLIGAKTDRNCSAKQIDEVRAGRFIRGRHQTTITRCAQYERTGAIDPAAVYPSAGLATSAGPRTEGVDQGLPVETTARHGGGNAN